MAVKFTNNAATTLAAGINSSVTSIAVTDGSVFPTITGSDHFYVTFDDTTNKEIVKVTARSGNTLTVVRGHDNTTARAFSSGDKAELRIVAALLDDVKTEVSSTLTVDTFTGNGSTTAFTLSVAPASEDNLIVFIEGVYQNPGDFTLSGTTLTLDVAPANSRKIIVYHVAALVSGNNLTHNQFTCNGSTTAFTLSLSPIHENNTQVFLDGVYQQKTDYAVSGTTLTMDTAPANGAILEVMTFTQTEVNTLPASFVSGLTQVTAVGADHFMIFDATDSALKKSLVSDVLESATSISTSADATAITIDSNEKVTFTSDVTTGGHLSVGGSNNELRFYEGSNYVGFEAPALSADKIWVLPAADGSNGQVIKTDGSGNLSFTTIDTSISANSVGITELNVSDGSNGQVLQTNGSGTLSFVTVSGGPTHKEGGTNFTNSIMIGDDSTGTISSADNNTGFGVDIFAALTSGARNTTMGVGSMAALTSGANNVAVGGYALASITDTHGNTAIGYQTQQNGAGAAYNVSVGYRAGRELTSGDNNVFIGAYAGDANTSGIDNVGIGAYALTENTSGTRNTAIGYEAGRDLAGGEKNVLVGYGCGNEVTSGANNVMMGDNAGTNVTSGSSNTLIGKGAGDSITTSNSNTCLGKEAGAAISTGAENTMIGDNAGSASTGAVNGNVAVGYQALYNQSGGGYNVAIGVHSLYNGASGHSNTCLGYSSGYHTGNGYRNVAIGYSVSIPSNTNHRYAIGYNNAGGQNTAYQSLSVHNGASGYVRLTVGSTTVSASSDERIKKDIEDLTYGLSFINRLRPVNYKLKLNSELPDPWKDEEVEDYDQGWMNGFIAQEVKSALDAENIPAEKVELWSEDADNGGLQSLGEAALIPMLVKALQEADDKIDALTARIEALES